jgi:hypothetical protein
LLIPDNFITEFCIVSSMNSSETELIILKNEAAKSRP